jgi:hypothetical protein
MPLLECWELGVGSMVWRRMELELRQSAHVVQLGIMGPDVIERIKKKR